MDRQFYLNLAAAGLGMPIGADVVLHDKADPEAVLSDGEQLGKLIEETAARYGTPLAFPHMDLELEKHALLETLEVAPEDMPQYHFSTTPDAEVFERVKEHLQTSSLTPKMQAQVDAIQHIAENTALLPIGMCIGPFSLMTKLVADPITPVCMAGMGIGAGEDEEIRLVEQVIELGLLVITHSIERQIDAGAKAIFIAEPAANQVYFSPNQIESGSDVFLRYVMAYNRRIKDLLNARGVDLIFHCCGELIDYMVSQFASLDPAILSLGSSRKLWEDAALVPKTTALFGNLPSKRFYSDDLISLQEVRQRADELTRKMREVGHPFILGTECDLLSVPGCQETISQKADAIAYSTCACGCRTAAA
jgi:uroporphyrinogen-III decarboxylase